MSLKGTTKGGLGVGPRETSESDRYSKHQYELILARLVLYDEPTTYTQDHGAKSDGPKSSLQRRWQGFWNGMGCWIGETGVDFRPAFGSWRSSSAGLGSFQAGWSHWAREELSEESLVIPLLVITFSCA
jgi:hypothetical protein